MKIIHHIAGNWDKKQVEALRKHGVSVQEGVDRVVLDESDERYRKIKPLVESWRVLDAVGTEFSAEDFKSASGFIILADWQWGYPQPEDDFGYLEVTYDTSKYCSVCGAGLTQKAPFHIKKEPKWGKKLAFILFWVLDEIFVHVDAYDRVFKPLGIQSWPVLIYKKNTIAQTVVQLVIPDSTVPLELDGYAAESCTKCGRKRYLPITRGFFPPFRNGAIPGRVAKTQEYYGSGASASKWIYASREAYSVIKKEKLAMSFWPVKGPA